ncbi:MAG: hypothetical protein K0T00_2361, partial [Gaiellaceae bacterium]|nr:hypothetical protein [Gaiellaceae bacterium]
MSSRPAAAQVPHAVENRLVRLVRTAGLETSLAVASLAAIGLHVLDDNFLRPQPG